MRRVQSHLNLVMLIDSAHTVGFVVVFGSTSCVLGKCNEEKASSKEAVSKWNDQEIGVPRIALIGRTKKQSTRMTCVESAPLGPHVEQNVSF